MHRSIKIIFCFSLLVVLFSCGKKDRWDVDTSEQNVSLDIKDISEDFFNTSIPVNQLKNQYYFFFDQKTEDAVWDKQRRDNQEIKIYQASKKNFGNNQKLKEELEKLFGHFKYYYPQAKVPKVYTYSSGLQNIYEPVMYSSKDALMFIAIDGFLGTESKLYDSISVYPYLRRQMLPESVLPMVVNAIGTEIVPFDARQQKFMDLLIYEGKKLILADALINGYSDALKIGYSAGQIEWSKANEGNIWNFFVENELVFSSDKKLVERFLRPAPFSKFQNNIEQESPGRIGAWIGWQICRKYLEENKDVSLQEFIANTNAQQIFNASKYKPEINKNYEAPQEPVQELENYEEK